MRAPARRPRPGDVRGGGVRKELRERPVRTGEVLPLGRVDDEPVGDLDELLELGRAPRRLTAPAEEDREVRDEERLDDARRRLRPRATQRELDHLGHEAAIGVRHLPPLDLRPRVDAVVVRVRLGEEEDRPRRVPLAHPGERGARLLPPPVRHPGDVRHHRRPHARCLGRRLVTQPRECRVHVGEANVLAEPGQLLHGRRHDRPSRWRSSSALGGPHDPEG